MVENNRECIKSKIRSFFQCNKEYPVVDKIVLIYVATVLFFQILFQISPVVTLLSKTPLYNIQTYLGLIGGVLIVVDLFTTKKIWKSRYSMFLYVILLLAAVASVRMMSYGIKENLFKLCWAAIQFVLVYSCAYRSDREELRKYIKYLIYILVAIWLLACCVSLHQFFEQIGYEYVVNPLAQDSSTTRQGFYDNRLFGIFYTLNHAAYISLFLAIAAFVCAWNEKNIFAKISLFCSAFIFVCHIRLSGSRSAAVSLIVCTVALAVLMLWKKAKKSRSTTLIVSVLVTVLMLSAFIVLGNALICMGSLENDVLQREGLEDDSSNGRISILLDYASLYREIGPVGLSPGNYMPYIMEHHPELYIVDYIRVNYPDKYDSGIIYHVHNGYVMVYVSAGILGLICLISYVALCMKDTFRIIFKHKTLSYVYIGAFILVIAGALSAVFDEGLFFQNTPHTTMFWFALGIIMTDHCGVIDNRQREEYSITHN